MYFIVKIYIQILLSFFQNNLFTCPNCSDQKYNLLPGTHKVLWLYHHPEEFFLCPNNSGQFSLLTACKFDVFLM